jgi:hypothetical protein
MSDAYRDERVALQARAHQLEDELKRRDAELDELRQRLSEQDAVLARLQGVLARKPPSRPKRWPLFAAGAVAFAGLAAAAMMLGRSRGAAAAPAPLAAPSPPAAASAAEVDTEPATSDAFHAPPPTPVAPLHDLCDRLGVRLTVDGSEAEAPAVGDRDQAGHKYRRDGTRAPWFNVDGGNLYIHGWGDFLPGDVGTSRLTMLDIMTKGETGGYTLARGGRSVMHVLTSDGKHVSGRFEADMSRVADVTSEPPFGTPVVRVRGNFCLPALPADPNDTGP